MSAVAGISMSMGMEVSGSADERNSMTDLLESRGMRFFLGHQAGQLGTPDAVVASAAVPEDNPELARARRSGMPVFLYAEYLALLMSSKRGIAIAGTHGKTTTTSMLTWLLDEGGSLDPLAVCGGVMRNYGANARFGGGEYLVAEACEYNRSFLSLHPYVSIITNVEPDHLDTYATFDEVKKAFGLFIKSTHRDGFSVVYGDDPAVGELVSFMHPGQCSPPPDRVVTVGLGAGNQYIIDDLNEQRGRYRFTLRDARSVGRDELNIGLTAPGVFNCVNAALAAVCALRLGVPPSGIEHAFGRFRGPERRLELLGSWNKNQVYTDYAHHPTEIHATISALREMHPGKRLIVLFQPHQYSRTVFLFDGLAETLAEADEVVITEVYRQRDEERHVRAVNGRRLAESISRMTDGRADGPGRTGGRCVYVHDKDDLPGWLESRGLHDSVVVFMGAGNIDDTARKFMPQGPCR